MEARADEFSFEYSFDESSDNLEFELEYPEDDPSYPVQEDNSGYPVQEDDPIYPDQDDDSISLSTDSEDEPGGEFQEFHGMKRISPFEIVSDRPVKKQRIDNFCAMAMYAREHEMEICKE